MDIQAAAPWHLYIVQTASGALYTGITNNVTRRFKQHQAGTGAKALRGKGPLALLFHCEAGDRSNASKLEYRIKQLTRQDKIRLVRHQPDSVEAWLAAQSRLKGAE